MREPITIAVAQPELASHAVDGNVESQADVVRRADARVVVFPELSLTGYELDAEPIDTADPRLHPLVDACAAAGSVALVGAPIIEEDGNRHIAMLAIGSEGPRVVYRKMHLGIDEAQVFRAGTEPAVVVVDGWRLGLAICKDTGVAQHAADTAAVGIDALVAGIVESADDAGVVDARARAIAQAHGVWVAIASCAGPTGGGFDATAGGSGVWRPDGSALERAGPSIGEVVRAVMD